MTMGRPRVIPDDIRAEVIARLLAGVAGNAIARDLCVTRGYVSGIRRLALKLPKMQRPPTFDWTDERLHRLRLLWTEGASASEIGRQLGTNKNSVIGKAHRLDLEKRPPAVVNRTYAPAKPKPVRAAGVPLPARVKTKPVEAALRPIDRSEKSPVVHGVAAQKLGETRQVGWDRFDVSGKPRLFETAYMPRPPRHAVLSTKPGVPCCYPIGEPRTPGFRFCDAPSVTKRGPYCAEHAAVAFERVERTAPPQLTGRQWSR